MIKINLLNSVTERHGSAAVAVERKIASPVSRLMLMTIAAAFLLVAVIGWDVVSTQMAKSEAERQLEEQKQIATQLEAVLKEQKELEAKIQNIDLRIEAIKKLRNSQAGPSAVLEAIRERITMVSGIYLESVEQSGDQLTLKGNSTDESAVTQFGRSLEFSSGLFSNLNIETQRKEAPNQPAAATDQPAPLPIVSFTIRTAYTPSKANTQQESIPTTASNQPQSGGASQNQAPNAPSESGSQNPPQVAKNQNN